MKCTWNKCGQETHKDCPQELLKHKEFDPRVLWIFFSGTEFEQFVLTNLYPMVCDKHKNELKQYLRRSTTSRKAAKKRKVKEDYSI